MKKIKAMVISAAFLYLNGLAIKIAHPLLRQFVQKVLSDAAEIANLMLDNDLSDPSVATDIFDAQQITAAAPKPRLRKA